MKSKSNSRHTLAGTFASHTANRKSQSLQKSQQVSSPKKNFKIFSRHSNKKNKTPDTQATADSSVMTADKKVFHSGQPLHRWTARQQPTTPCRQWRGQWWFKQFCVLFTFVSGDSFVAVNPPLRQAVNRYASCLGDIRTSN